MTAEVLAKVIDVGQDDYLVIYAWPAESPDPYGRHWLGTGTPPWDGCGFYARDAEDVEDDVRWLIEGGMSYDHWLLTEVPAGLSTQWQPAPRCAACGHLHWIPAEPCGWEPDDYPDSPRCACQRSVDD